MREVSNEASEEVYREKSLNKTGDDLGTEYVIDLLKRFELVKTNMKRLQIIALKKDKVFMHSLG